MENKETLLRYILGEMSQEERESLEERYFVNDETWAELEAAETDLIDSFLRNELSKPQRDRFERYFLASPRRRRRLEFARIHMADSSGPGAEQAAPLSGKLIPSGFNFAMRLGFGLAAVVLIAVEVILAIQNFRLRHELNKMLARETTLQQQLKELQQQVANQASDHNGKRGTSEELLAQDLPTISLVLMPGELRGSGKPSPVLPVSSVPSTVLLLLELREDHFTSYDVTLRTVEGKEIRRLEKLKSISSTAAGPAVAVRLPSQLFQRGDYIVMLLGRTQDGKAGTIDSFTFSVVR